MPKRKIKSVSTKHALNKGGTSPVRHEDVILAFDDNPDRVAESGSTPAPVTDSKEEEVFRVVRDVYSNKVEKSKKIFDESEANVNKTIEIYLSNLKTYQDVASAAMKEAMAANLAAAIREYEDKWKPLLNDITNYSNLILLEEKQTLKEDNVFNKAVAAAKKELSDMDKVLNDILVMEQKKRVAVFDYEVIVFYVNNLEKSMIIK